MAGRIAKWRGRLNLGQIEDLAALKVQEFQQRLKEAGLSVPPIPPVPAEYIALTISELSVRGVPELLYDGKPLSGLLDMERAEILYNENEPAGRRAFTIAHELGHYFLHYLPAVEMARQPTLFDGLDFPHFDKLKRAEKPAARFFRCNDLVVAPAAPEESTDEPVSVPRLTRCQLEDTETQANLAKIIRLKELADRTEWEANIFARGLLMPSELVRWLNKKHDGEVAVMADELGVTQTALRYRLNGLNLRHDENMGLGASYSSKTRTFNPSSENSSNKSPIQGTFF